MFVCFFLLSDPGHTNAQEILCCTDRALTYNDTAVLESYHACMTFRILRREPTNLIAHLPIEHQRLMRTQIITAIMATDLGVHFDKLHRMMSIGSLSELDRTNEKDRCLLMSFIIHSADLSGQTMPFAIASQWESRISDEFTQQSHYLSSLGLPTESFMEHLDDLEVRYTLQVSFIDFVLLPWWVAVTRLLPGALAHSVKQLHENRARFAQLASDAKEAKEAISSTATSTSTSASTSTNASTRRLQITSQYTSNGNEIQ